MALARLLDDAGARGVLVSEGEASIVASDLNAVDAASLSLGAAGAGWTARILDAAGTEWSSEGIDEAFEPFAVTIVKPAQPDGTLAVLTVSGLTRLLKSDAPQKKWLVGILLAPIRTWDILLLPWGEDEPVAAELPTVNPRRLVREIGTERVVPASLAKWLLRGGQDVDLNDPGQRIWALEAGRRITASLANEIDPDTQQLMFRGPPRLMLDGPARGQDVSADLFRCLQEAGTWVYENERETQLRHALLATEVARSGGGGDVFARLESTLRPSLDGARIAYEMSVSGMSAETLKALADLRRAVTDETAKVTEATRQTIAALTGALAVGVGLVAARLATKTDPSVLFAVMGVAALYMILVSLSGAQFVLLQRRVRGDWQATLYRFLPPADYRRLVTKPTGRAEFAFWTAAVVGLVAVALLFVAVVRAAPVATPTTDGQAESPGCCGRSESASAAAHREGSAAVDADADRADVRSARTGRRGSVPPMTR